MPNSSAAEKAQHKLYPAGAYPAKRLLNFVNRRYFQWTNAAKKQKRLLTASIGRRQARRIHCKSHALKEAQNAPSS